MKTPIYKLFLFAALFSSGSALLSSCSKNDDIGSTSNIKQGNTASDALTAPQGMRTAASGAVDPMASMFDQTLMVASAKVNAGGSADVNDVTAQFNGYSFQFMGSKEGNGTATATSGRSTVYGKWTMNPDNSINFSFPTEELSTLTFMNKNWSIDSGGSPTGTNDNPTTTNLVSPNGDILHFRSTNSAGPR